MISELIDNLTLLRALQRLNIDPKGPAYISNEHLICTLGVNQTKTYMYEAVRITTPGLFDALIIDNGCGKVFYRYQHGNVLQPTRARDIKACLTAATPD